MKVFAIVNAQGKMSRGGQRPKFDDWGKFWRKKGNITNHLIGVESRGGGYRRGLRPSDGKPERLYDGCDVVEYELVEVSRKPVQEYIDGYKNRREEAERKRKEAEIKRKEQAEKAQLAALKKKYPDG